VDWVRAGSAAAAPVAQAVENANAARNQFLMNQLQHAEAVDLNRRVSDRQLQIAREQHGMQLQREQMRDDRMTHVAELRAKTALEEIRQKHDLNSLEKSVAFLRNQVGGVVPARLAGEGDSAYKNRVDETAAKQVEANTQADAQAKVSIRKRREELTGYLSANAPAFQQVAQLAAQSTKAEAAMAAQKAFLNSRPEVGNLVGQGASFEEALKKTNSFADFMQTFNGYHQAMQSQWLHQNGTLAGGAAAKLAAAKSELQLLDKQEHNLDLMPGENGRTVPRFWASRSSNLADEWMLRDKQKPAAAPAASVRPLNPVLAPAPGAPPISFGESAGGESYSQPVITPPAAALGTRGGVPELFKNGPLPAPSGAGVFTLDQNNQVQFVPSGGPVMLGGSPAAMAAQPAIGASPQDLQWMHHMVEVWGRSGIRSPAPAPAMGQVVMVPNASVAATPQANVMVAPMPEAQAIPAGASIAPEAGLFAPSFQPEVSDGVSAYDDALNALRMRNLYAPQ
jgi:hypothetical protein